MLLVIYALSMLPPVAGAVYSAVRWWRDRRILDRAFREGRERRLHPCVWGEP